MATTVRDDGLAAFGYQPKLDRTLGRFHTFAAGISYLSILTGTFQLFYLGFGLGSPAYWSWPMVFVGQLLVALCFAVTVPDAAPPYHWYLRWGAVLFVGIVALGGFAYYWLVRRHRSGVLAEHQALTQAVGAAT